ncbi:5-formyltetrahydrofolate cyclo-ligase [Sphingobacterium shayense]|uniref:5-formyltetrahydrofolate cyclo-ligase n=1 Tax=Sphingobacterium shayense TaxID=626343 RepID=UPI001552C33D|nr:5-formyltetrahydrofolate cyclo-ligase [Sphingobacterium shayense]NQD72398.1 5-formyltetrahydrofolate cyclo-ligase [Sphingobacterium shayense]
MDKASLRIKYRMARAGLSPEQLSTFNDRILDHLLNLDYSAITYVHTFLPIRDNNEPNMWRYIERVKKLYPRIRLVISRSNPIDHSMDHFLYSSELELVENRWGIAQPKSGLRIEEAKLDLVIVPLLVADQNGGRVGYGKGFYDRFLAKCRPDCLKVGVSFFDPVANISDVDRYDILLDKLVTPQAVISFA